MKITVRVMSRAEGAVGLMIEAGGQQVGVLLGPEDALIVADRIRRAASRRTAWRTDK